MVNDPPTFSITDSGATLTLNCPKVLNAIDFRLLKNKYDYLFN